MAQGEGQGPGERRNGGGGAAAATLPRPNWRRLVIATTVWALPDHCTSGWTAKEPHMALGSAASEQDLLCRVLG